jgi:ClpP class serine protease
VLSDLQAECDNFYNLFVKTVSAGRKGFQPAAIRGTEAKTFLGKEAVDRGLADSVGTFESTLADISRGLARTMSIPAKGAKMDATEGAPAANAGISLADHTAALSKASSDATAVAAKAAQTRIETILNCEEAKDRAKMANHLAFKTDMSAEAAIALLAESPKGEAPKAATPSIAERQDLALGGVAERPNASKTAAADLNPTAIYESRRKAIGR